MLATIRSLGVKGIGGYGVSVEVFVSNGLVNFDIVGLPDAAVREARERVRAAIKSNGFKFPVSRVTVNLAPADTKKAGTVYDLPIMLGILAATGVIRQPKSDCAFFGELSLNGTLRPVSGALPMAVAAAREGVRELFVPADNAQEASYAEGVTVYPIENVSELIAHLRGEFRIKPMDIPKLDSATVKYPDFSDVKGQENVKRAMEIAAAGGHNILMVGPPGAGKSMMSKRLPGILPDMTREEMLKSTEIYSVAGLTGKNNPIISARPFRAPHHTVSGAAMSGGGAVPRPGEISLAHNGVLFLDEFAEFSRSSLEVLREPLENSRVTISRAKETVSYPARFTLIAAMNPCPCGNLGNPLKPCTCSPMQINRYKSRISGPLLDRIDLTVNLNPVKYTDWNKQSEGETSAQIRARVLKAREIQRERFKNSATTANAFMTSKEIKEFCKLPPGADEVLETAMRKFGLSARSLDKILKTARTIADLEGKADIEVKHLVEVMQYRPLDRKGVADI